MEVIPVRTVAEFASLLIKAAPAVPRPLGSRPPPPARAWPAGLHVPTDQTTAVRSRSTGYGVRPSTRRLDQLVHKWAKCLGERSGLAEVGHVCARQFGERGVQLRSEMCGYFVSPVARRRRVAVVAAGRDEAW